MDSFDEFLVPMLIVCGLFSTLVCYACIKVGGDYDKKVEEYRSRQVECK